MQAAHPFGKVRDAAEGQGALMHRMPVSTCAHAGWYCCVQISGRGSVQATNLEGGTGAGAFSGAPGRV